MNKVITALRRVKTQLIRGSGYITEVSECKATIRLESLEGIALIQDVHYLG